MERTFQVPRPAIDRLLELAAAAERATERADAYRQGLVDSLGVPDGRVSLDTATGVLTVTLPDPDPDVG